MLTFILSVIAFAYLLYRISTLETQVKNLSGKKLEEIPQKPETVPESIFESMVETTPIPQNPTSVPVPVMTSAAPNSSQTDSSEFAIGSKVLTGVGVFALLLGVGFFVRYAFQNNLISPVGRIILGVIFGLIVATVGHFLKNKYKAYGLTLVGAGLGVMYISFYSGYVFYGLLGSSVVFVLLLLITVVGVALSLLYDSIELVTFSFIGAFIIPFILPLSESVHGIFSYLLILNIAVLLVARYKVWPVLTLGSLIGSCLVYAKWTFGDSYSDHVFLETFIYGTIIFLIYFITTIINFLKRDRDYKGIDSILLYSVPFLYFVLNIHLFTTKDEYAFLAIAIAAFNIVASLGLRALLRDQGEINTLSNALLLIASPFVALAITLHFEGKVITVLLAFEALVMVANGFLLKAKLNRIAGLVLAVLSGVSLVVVGFDLDPLAVAIFNTRALTFLLLTMVSFGIWFAYMTNTYYGHAEITSDEEVGGKWVGVLGAFLIPMMWIFAETEHFSTQPYVYIPLYWSLYGAALISISFIARESAFRFVSYVALAISPFFLIAARISYSSDPFINPHVLAALVYVAILCFVYVLIKKHQSDIPQDEIQIIPKIIIVVSNIVMFLTGSIEIINYFDKQAASNDSYENIKQITLSVFWLVYAGISLAVGFIRRSAFARQLSILLFALAIAKIFLYDSAGFSDIYRVVSFMTLGIILLIAGFAYYKFKDRITMFVQGKDGVTTENNI